MRRAEEAQRGPEVHRVRPDRGWYPRQRATTAELMDDPESDRRALERTLTQFALVNRILSRMRGLLRLHVIDDIRRRGVSSATVLDVGAGACDIPLWLVNEAARSGVELRITCLDHDPRVVEFARRRTARTPAVAVVHGSVFESQTPYDYVICNHFLHHLEDGDILRFLDLSFSCCRRRLLINDLLRSYWSLIGFEVLSGVLLRNSFARFDGSLSIRRGFRPCELEQLVAASRWRGRAHVRRTVPGRVYIVGSRLPA